MTTGHTRWLSPGLPVGANPGGVVISPNGRWVSSRWDVDGSLHLTRVDNRATSTVATNGHALLGAFSSQLGRFVFVSDGAPYVRDLSTGVNTAIVTPDGGFVTNVTISATASSRRTTGSPTTAVQASSSASRSDPLQERGLSDPLFRCGGMWSPEQSVGFTVHQQQENLVAMFVDEPVRPEQYQRFQRPTPTWFKDSGFGVFVHWGAYSVPAWAEPIGELGTIEKTYWFAHNPYAEWYYNTIRIDGSPAQQHQREVFGGAPYDDFLDQWKAESFDPADLTDLFRRAGARFVIPTSKHHDGITLWDAPGTGERNTVRRGPHRDLIGEFAAATREAGMRFGVYYSSGLDWHAAPTPPIRQEDTGFFMPNDAVYAEYAYKHVMDLIDRYSPDVLWGDIGYPDAGTPEGPFSLVNVLDRYYDVVPDGVVNDRWGRTHWDFRTSEYQQGTSVEGHGMWQNTRGIGYSFGYNQCEDASHYLDAAGAVRHLMDVVSRGGNFLLNVGPDAAGRIPELQRRCLEGMAAWMAVNTDAVHAVAPLDESIAGAGEDPWTRWTSGDGFAFAAVDARGPHTLPCDVDALDLASTALLDGTSVQASAEPGGVSVQLPSSAVEGPAVLKLRLR